MNFTSQATRKTYQQAIQQFISFATITSPKALHSVKQADVLIWRETLRGQGYTNRTICNKLSALSSLFDHLCEKQIMPTNPVKGVKRPKLSQQRVVTPSLTVEQVKTMMSTPNKGNLRELRDWALLHVLFYTGCRE
ncbi:tyrosine-type recombinase/integrase [Pseudoalteromonas rubra]|uniref:tyrosine-type recombinase/integrase n=1 Tax=Pseudoalteromonas rubra TaxID=43658 RepID=UPI000F7A119E|nr:site-specific integrase [Pseudoalteromonas rubra]